MTIHLNPVGWAVGQPVQQEKNIVRQLVLETLCLPLREWAEM